jgi:hypothetical protein
VFVHSYDQMLDEPLHETVATTGEDSVDAIVLKRVTVWTEHLLDDVVTTGKAPIDLVVLGDLIDLHCLDPFCSFGPLLLI